MITCRRVDHAQVGDPSYWLQSKCTENGKMKNMRYNSTKTKSTSFHTPGSYFLVPKLIFLSHNHICQYPMFLMLYNACIIILTSKRKENSKSKKETEKVKQ